ncbi:MAG: Hint domain-containing protein [Pseudomonadota bacterium]
MPGICFSVPHNHIAVFSGKPQTDRPIRLDDLPPRSPFAAIGEIALLRVATDRYGLFACTAEGQADEDAPLLEGLRAPHLCAHDCVVFGLSGGPGVVIALDGFADTAPQGDLNAYGFLGGTRVLGRTGVMSIERLVSGDVIWTMNNGMQPIRWIARKELAITAQTDRLRPIRITKDAFEQGCPSETLHVLPTHQISTEELGLDLTPLPTQPCVSAEHLLNGETVDRVTDQDCFELFEIGLDQPDMIYASGLMVQNAPPHNRRRISAVPSAGLRRFTRHFPDLGKLFHETAPPTQQTVLAPRYGAA